MSLLTGNNVPLRCCFLRVVHPGFSHCLSPSLSCTSLRLTSLVIMTRKVLKCCSPSVIRHLAAAEGQMAAAEWLLKKHCNPNPVDRFARTPLEVLPCKLLTPILCPYALLAWSHAATRAVIPLTNRFSPASLVASVAYPACLDEIRGSNVSFTSCADMSPLLWTGCSDRRSQGDAAPAAV